MRNVGAGQIWLNADPLAAQRQIRSGDIVRMSDDGPDLEFTIVSRSAQAAKPAAAPVTDLPAGTGSARTPHAPREETFTRSVRSTETVGVQSTLTHGAAGSAAPSPPSVPAPTPSPSAARRGHCSRHRTCSHPRWTTRRRTAAVLRPPP